jgi:hypothetical protein
VTVTITANRMHMTFGNDSCLKESHFIIFLFYFQHHHHHHMHHVYLYIPFFCFLLVMLCNILTPTTIESMNCTIMEWNHQVFLQYPMSVSNFHRADGPGHYSFPSPPSSSSTFSNPCFIIHSLCLSFFVRVQNQLN